MTDVMREDRRGQGRRRRVGARSEPGRRRAAAARRSGRSSSWCFSWPAISLWTPNFLKPGNIGNILAQTAVIAIVAMGQHLVILTRGIDLSVGVNLALATVIGALVFRVIDSAPLVTLAMLATGALRRARSTASSTSSGACRIPSSSRSRRSASAAASRSRCRSTTRPCAGCPRRSRGSAAASTFGFPNSFFVVLAVRARPSADDQGDGLGPLDLRRRRRAEGRGRDGHPGQVGAGLHLRDLRALRRHRRGRPRRPHRRGLAALRQPARARHDRRRHHRRRELPRRARPYRPRAGRRGDDRRHPQRAEPAQRRRLLPDDRHRRDHRGRGRGRRAAQPSRGARPRAAGGEARNERGARRPRRPQRAEALRRRACAQGRQPRGLSRRGAGAARRQRRRQVDAGQMHQRRPRARRGRDPARRRGGGGPLARRPRGAPASRPSTRTSRSSTT